MLGVVLLRERGGKKRERKEEKRSKGKIGKER